MPDPERLIVDHVQERHAAFRPEEFPVGFGEQGGDRDDETPRRRMYRLTGAGAHAAREALTTTQRLLGAPPPAVQPQAGTA
jgi:hypothetical protein